MITIDQLQAAFKRKGFIMTDFNPFGIRRNDNIDLFTDIRGVLYKVNGTWQIQQIAATTKPSLKSLMQPVNPLGCALWAEGQYINTHVIGLHEGHDALTQIAPIKVYRINSKDGKIDITNLSPVVAGPECGLNIHGVWASNIPGWDGTYPKVDACGNWGEGCQVAARPSEHAEFMRLCRASGLKWFNYALLNINDIQQ